MDYYRKKAHYQTDEVALDYDATRWSNSERRWSNRRKLLAICRAVDHAAGLGHPIRKALDLPCGTGRIFPALFSREIGVIGADLSAEMMRVARNKSASESLQRGFIRCDAEFLPFRKDSFDAVLSVRFLFHLPLAVRQNALKEMSRISRRWLIVDYRHRYTLKYLLKQLAKMLGWESKPYVRLSREEIAEDFRKAGVELIKIFPTFPLFSDKWVILGRKIP